MLLGKRLNAFDIIFNRIAKGDRALVNSLILRVNDSISIVLRDCATAGSLDKAFITEDNPVILPICFKGSNADENRSMPVKSTPLNVAIAVPILASCLPIVGEILKLPTFFSFSRLSASFDIFSKPLPSISFKVLLIFLS